MIPKQIFFIWLGDNKPNYVDFAVNAFKEVNPDFNVELIEFTFKDLDNPSDKILKESIKIIKDKRCPQYMYWRKKCHPRYKYVVQVQEIYRFLTIKKYGGIYLDCDTFPIKPFDKTLLNMDNFCCSTYWSTDNTKRNRDISFFGHIKDITIENYLSFKNTIDIVPDKYFNNKSWLFYKEKFFKCELKIGETACNSYYIDHYFTRLWKLN